MYLIQSHWGAGLVQRCPRGANQARFLSMFATAAVLVAVLVLFAGLDVTA
jgi:hypothetical protein